MNIQKRDKTVVLYEKNKISNAVNKVFKQIYNPEILMEKKTLIEKIIENVDNSVNKLDNSVPVNVETIQNIIEEELMTQNEFTASKSYIIYRETHKKKRNKKSGKMPEEAIQDYIFTSRYSRFLPEKQRRETYSEAVQRVEEMHLKKYPEAKEEIKWAFQQVMEKKVLPSMRSLQFGGTPIELKNEKIYNCSFSVCDRIDFFKETLYLLLCGVGVGFSVEFEHVDKLSPLAAKIDETNVVHHSIEDSIEGWGNAIDELVKSYVRGYLVEFNYSMLRPKGSLIKISGGRSPGHVPLRKAIEKIRTILDNSLGRKLKPIEVYDIVMNSCDAVLAGGVRRCLKKGTMIYTTEGLIPIQNVKVGMKVYDSQYQEKRITKVLEQGLQNVFRIVTDRGEVYMTKEHRMATQHGWKNVNDFKRGDCLVPFKGIVKGKEKSLLESGAELNEDLIWRIVNEDRTCTDISPEIHSMINSRFTKVPNIVFQANEELKCAYIAALIDAQRLLQYDNFKICRTRKISFIKDVFNLMTSLGITPNVFYNEKKPLDQFAIIKDNNEEQLQKILKYVRKENEFVKPQKDEKKLAKILDIFAMRQPIETYDIEVEDSNEFFADGFLSHNSATICLFSSDDGEMMSAKTGDWFNTNPQRGRSNNSVKLIRDEVSKNQFLRIFEKQKQWGEPGFYFADNINYGTNPCISGDSIISTDKGDIQLLELMQRIKQNEKFKALSLNIVNNTLEYKEIINVFKTKENAELMNLSYSSLASRGEVNLKITEDHKVWINEMEWKKVEDINLEEDVVLSYFTVKNKNFKVLFNLNKIEKTNNEDVYDITVNENHNFFANGICIHNCVEIGLNPFIPPDYHKKELANKSGWGFCNLTEINGCKLKSVEDFKVAVKAATIIGTIQAGYTDFPYVGNVTEEICKREALLGVSITGMMDNPEITFNPEIQKEMALYACEVNKEIAEKINIQPASRITAVKPAGCQVKETLVTTENGLMYLEELGDVKGETWQKINAEVYTDKDIKKAPKFFVNSNEKSKTKKIITENGVTIEATLNHQFRIIKNQQYVWCKVEDLKIGDCLPYSVGEYMGGNIQKLNTDEQKIKEYKIKKQETLNKDIAFLLGVYYRCGKHGNKNLQIQMHPFKFQTLETIKQILLDTFNIFSEIKETKNKISLTIENKSFLKWLKNNNFNIKIKKIPQVIRMSTKEIILSFMKGLLFNSENLENLNDFSYETKVENYAVEIVKILRAIGIPTYIHSELNKKKQFCIKRINKKMLNSDVNAKLDLLKNKGFEHMMVDHVKSITDSENYTYDIEVEDTHTYIANSFISHNTTSLVFGSASGIHPRHTSKKYFRRVQANTDDPVYKHFKKHNPHCCEPSKWSANNTDDVITFCIEPPENSIGRENVGAIDLLEKVLLTQNNWVKYGTARPETSPKLMHNVSNTISVKEHEWDEVAEFIWKNRNSFTGVAMLPFSGDKMYVQAPHEEVTTDEDKSKWEYLIENYNTVDYTTMNEDADNTALKDVVACAGGTCELF